MRSSAFMIGQKRTILNQSKKVTGEVAGEAYRTMITAIRNATHLGVKIRAPSPAPTSLEVGAGVEVGKKPLNLAFLMDVSDSMAGERLSTVKRTLHAARTLFRSTDRVTLVTFGDHGNTVADHLLLDEEGIRTFYENVDALGTSGCTNLSAGIETLVVTQKDGPFDAVVILTDGCVNRGITSTVGLQTMCTGFGTAPITAIGYGANHNRILLRNLALATRGSYVFVDKEALIPIAIGDLISGIRHEVLTAARLTVPAGWVSCELGPCIPRTEVADPCIPRTEVAGPCFPRTEVAGPPILIGNIVRDREYWVVYERSREPEDGPIVLTDATGYHEELTAIIQSDCHDLHEQVLRCRVTKALAAMSDDMEAHSLRTLATMCHEIDRLHEEFAELPDAMLMRPLILRMKAQIAEVLASNSTSDEVMARMSSGVAYLSSQRGVTADPDDQCFSSPAQRVASAQVHANT